MRNRGVQMIKLSGILDYSMGGFLCLRGFADYKILSKASKENNDIQRALIEEHKGEMAAFLNNGEYRFFPEVVLSVSLATGNNYNEVDRFFTTVQQNGSWREKLGDFEISIFNHDAGDRNKIAHISFDELKYKLNRIDGNHRLSASDEVRKEFKIPFCIIFCRNNDEEDQYSRAIFHNVNAKQIPLNLEENLKVILKSDGVFSDEKLKTDPSFGWQYYLARKISQQENFEEYPFINLLIRDIKYTYLLQVCQLLIENQTLPRADEAVNSFREQLPQIEAALQEAQLHVIPNNLAVIGAISFYKLTNAAKYQHFLSWAKENSITRAPGLHMNDLIQIFEQIYENRPKSIFVSMQFSVETEDTYQTIKDVRDILKRENGFEIKLIKVDEHHDGYSDEIYHRIINGIKESSLVIADLSFGNKNVHHEIGYAQGLSKKVLLLYKTRDDVPTNSEIGSNISMHDQVRFRNQVELRPVLLKKIRQFFGIEVDD
jgi:hypothetical protein